MWLLICFSNQQIDNQVITSNNFVYQFFMPPCFLSLCRLQQTLFILILDAEFSLAAQSNGASSASLVLKILTRFYWVEPKHVDRKLEVKNKVIRYWQYRVFCVPLQASVPQAQLELQIFPSFTDS